MVSRPLRTRRLIALACFVTTSAPWAAAAFLPTLPAAAAQPTAATWTSLASSYYVSPGNWSSNPYAPVNGSPLPDSTYDAFIDLTGGSYLVLVAYDTTVNSITQSAPGATLLLDGYECQLSATVGGINLSAGTFRLADGNLANTTVTASPGATVSIAPNTSSYPYSYYVSVGLTNVTLNADVTATAGNNYGHGTTTIHGDFTLAAGHTFTVAPVSGEINTGTVYFDGPSRVSGNGTIQFTGGAYTPKIEFDGDSTTIAPGITITTGPSSGGVVSTGGGAPVVNSGTLWARTPNQTLSVSGSWASLGTLKITDGTLDLGAAVSTPTLNNSVVQTGGSLVLHGPVNNAGYTFTPVGSTTLASTLTGGALTASPGNPLVVSGGTLDSVDLQSDLVASGTGTVTLTNTQLNGHTLDLHAASRLQLAQSLTTPGQITTSNPNPGTGYILPGVVATAPGVTLGPAISLTTVGSALLLTSSGPGASLINRGTVAAGYVTVDGNVVNQGSIQTTAAGSLYVVGPAVTNAGSITAAPGSTVSFAADPAGVFVNSGTIAATDSNVTFSNTWSNTGSINLTGGSLTLSGTSTGPGTFNATNTAVSLLGPAPTAGSFSGCPVTVAAPYTSAQLTSLPLSATSSVTLAAGAAVDNASYTLPLSAAAAPWSLAGGSIAGGSITSADATPLTAATGSSTLSSLSATAPILVSPKATLTLSSVALGAPLTVSAGSAVTLTNTTNNSTITLSGTLSAGATPTGAVAANPGSSLSFSGPTSNLAGVSATGATLTAASTSYVPADFRSVTATGSSFRLGSAAVLDLTADNLTLPNSNTFALAGGKITGGTIARPISAVTGTSTLDNTTLASELTLANGSATATGTVTFAPGSSVRFAGTAVGGTLTLPGNSLAGTADVIFDSTSASSPLVQGATSLTIGPNITIRTGPNLTSPTSTVGGSFMPLVNQGTISSQIAGRAISLNTSSLTNTGTIEAKNGGIIRLVGTYTPASVATVSTSAGGYAFLSGTLNNAPSGTLTISAAHAIGLGPAGSIRLGTVTTTDSTPLTVYPFSASTLASTITGAAVLTPVSLLAGSTLTATNTTFSSAISAAGATLNLNGSYSLPGGLALSAGSAANYNGTATGTIGPISVTDSTLTLNTNLDLAGATLALSPTSTLNVNGVSSTSNPATLSNTTVTGGGTVSLNFGAGSALSNVTLAGTTGLTIPATTPYAELRNGLTMNGGRLSFSSTAGGRVSIDSLAGSGEIVLDGTYGGTIGPRLSNTLNLPAGFTARTGTTGGTLLVNNVAGLVSAQTPGRPLTLSAASVTGAAEARNGGTLIVTGGLIAYNSNGVTLSTGTYNVFDGSTLSLSFGSSLYANAANLTLSGPTATVYRIQSLNTNSGSLTLSAGQKLTLTSPSLTNSGAITVGTSSALEVTGALVNPGTLTLASSSGALLVDYAGASPLDALRDNLQTGHLTTSVPNAAVAYFEASQLNLTTYAGLPVDGTTLLTKVTAPGDANLDGRVDADDYALLDRSFAMVATNAHWTDGDFNYDGAITPADFLAIDTTYGQAHSLSPAFLSLRESQFGPDYVTTLVAAVPEPSLLGCGLIAVAVAPRRRRR